MGGDGGDQIIGIGGVAILLDRDDRDGLEVDPPGPGVAHLGEERPRDPVLRGGGIEMGADQRRAVGEGRAKREIHAAADVGGGPVGGTVGGDRTERAHEGAVGIGAARPDVALVEMGVHVDEGRPDHAGVEIEPRHAGDAAGGGDGLDAALGDDDVDPAEALGVGLGPGVGEEHAGDRGVGENVARQVGHGGEAAFGHVSSPGEARSRATCAAGGTR